MKTKNIISIALLSLSAAVACSNIPSASEGEFLVEGSLSAVPDSTVVVIHTLQTKNFDVVSQDLVIDGKFSMKGTISNDGAYCGVIFSGEDGRFVNSSRQIFIKPQTTIRIEGDSLSNMMLWDIQSTNNEQKMLKEYDAITLDYHRKVTSILNLQKGIYQKINADTKTAQKAYYRHRDELEYYSNIRDNIFAQNLNQRLEYLKGQKVNQTWLMLFGELVKPLQYEKVDSLFAANVKQTFEALPAKYRDSEWGEIARASIYPPKVVAIGEQFVDATLYDVNGNEHTLSELKGKYILLDFWSLGCGPCVASFSEAERLAEHYADKLAIVGISKDDEKVWRAFVKERGLKGNHWNELSEEEFLAKTYGVKGIPSYVLISPTGVVVTRWSGYGKGSLEDRLRRYLGTK